MNLTDGGGIDLYSGNDDRIVPLLSLGGKGVISVLSNVAPAQAHEICAAYFAGDVKQRKAPVRSDPAAPRFVQRSKPDSGQGSYEPVRKRDRTFKNASYRNGT